MKIIWKRGKDSKNMIPARRKVIWALTAAGFCAMEFPGILMVGDRVYPFVLGMPFLYGYIIICWAYMTAVLFYAWRTEWGRRPFFRKEKRGRSGLS